MSSSLADTCRVTSSACSVSRLRFFETEAMFVVVIWRGVNARLWDRPSLVLDGLDVEQTESRRYLSVCYIHMSRICTCLPAVVALT